MPYNNPRPYHSITDLLRELEQEIRTKAATGELQQEIVRTVQDVKDTAVKAAGDIAQAVRNQRNIAGGYIPTYNNPNAENNKTPHTGAAQNHVPTVPYTPPVRKTVSKPPMIDKSLAVRPRKVPGRVSGTFFSIAGLSGAIVAGVAALSYLGTAAMAAPLVAASAFMVLAGRGFALTGRADRYAKYYNEMRTVTFCPVQELAEKVNKSPKFVVRELKAMIKQNLFKEGHLDSEGKTFILDHETYRHYLDSRKKLEAEKAEQAKKEKNPELEATIQEGMLCIQKIREANDAIPGEVISEKLDRLESVIRRIFEFMEKYPDRLSEIRRFTSYYLPTTLKLVEAYREFDAQEIQGETVQESKKEIEGALDTVNRAFENMYDKLFEQSARDLSADISVLQTMLKQEGYEKDEITGA